MQATLPEEQTKERSERCCRSLTPRTVMHFPQHGHWKLVGLGAWARAGDPCGIELYDVRYAAPELLQADLHAVCF